MSAATTTTGNPRSSGYERNANDFYVEPARAVEALLDVEAFDGDIWDPACGSGNTPRICRARGLDAFGSDIVDRGCYSEVADFFQHVRSVQNVITNPPFNISVRFAVHALQCANRKVCVLQRTTWLEGERRYHELFARQQLARVWQFRSRISMPPGGTAVEAKGGSVAFAWYVFERYYHGLPTLGWLP